MTPYPGTALQVGSTGESVRIMQEYLNAILQPSPHLTEDGVFGPKTKAAVIAFQQQFGLNPDGITGPLTWAEIMRQAAYSPVPAGTKTVVIDPGHGGTDWGAVHYYRKEKDDNLRLAQAVHDVLEAHGQDLRIIMTRYDDVFLTLAERSAVSNQNNADLFVSIHRNSSENRDANGVENYVFTAASEPNVLYAHNVLDEIVDEEISIGDYVLTGGEIPAMVLVDSVSRYVEGALDEEAVKEESFSEGLLEYPQYTRPEMFLNRKVPEVLISGHHENIKKWRKEQAYDNTYKKRQDLLK